MNCEHDFKLLDVVYSKKAVGVDSYIFSRTAAFYCRKCLAIKENRKEKRGKQKPEWFPTGI